MVAHVVRSVPQPEQRARRVQRRGYPRQHIDIVPDPLDLRAVVEVRRTDRLPHDIPRPVTAPRLQLLLPHDIQKLRVHLPCLPYPFRVYKVVPAPLGVEPVLLRAEVDVEEGEVVALGHEEFLPRRIALLDTVLGSEEYGGYGEHADDDEDLGGAAARVVGRRVAFWRGVDQWGSRPYGVRVW